MYLDIEKRAEEFAAAVLCVEEHERGPIATAFVCGANEMLEVIKKEHELVKIQEEPGCISIDDEIYYDKQLRKGMDQLIQQLRRLPESREREISLTRLQEAVMWLGMDLKRLGTPNPYPSSKAPETGSKIEPTADGLKL